MNRIVLHAGPEKCGSSSIQSAVLDQSYGLGDLVHGVMLSSQHVLELDCAEPSAQAQAYFHALIKEAKAAHPTKTLVLSHEMMFKMVHVLVNLSKIAREHVQDVRVIAYIRRQSDFLASSFGQWLFRAPERLAQTRGVLKSHDLDPMLFWGVERHLMAAILGGWDIGRQLSGHLYFDWSKSIAERQAKLAVVGAQLLIGLLPRAGFETPIVPDFLLRAGLPSEGLPKGRNVVNPAYHPSMIEAVVNAIEAGFAMPGPHEANDFFVYHSPEAAQLLKPEIPFITRLKAHIDTVFLAENTQLAQNLGLSPEYFAPAQHIDGDVIRKDMAEQAVLRAQIPAELRQREQLSRAALAQTAWALFQGRTA